MSVGRVIRIKGNNWGSYQKKKGMVGDFCYIFLFLKKFLIYLSQQSLVFLRFLWIYSWDIDTILQYCGIADQVSNQIKYIINHFFKIFFKQTGFILKIKFLTGSFSLKRTFLIFFFLRMAF